MTDTRFPIIEVSFLVNDSSLAQLSERCLTSNLRATCYGCPLRGPLGSGTATLSIERSVSRDMPSTRLSPLGESRGLTVVAADGTGSECTILSLWTRPRKIGHFHQREPTKTVSSIRSDDVFADWTCRVGCSVVSAIVLYQQPILGDRRLTPWTLTDCGGVAGHSSVVVGGRSGEPGSSDAVECGSRTCPFATHGDIGGPCGVKVKLGDVDVIDRTWSPLNGPGPLLPPGAGTRHDHRG